MGKNTNTLDHTNKKIHIPTNTNAQDDASTITQNHTNKIRRIIQYKIRNTQDHISDYNERSLFPVPCNLHSLPAGDVD